MFMFFFLQYTAVAVCHDKVLPRQAFVSRQGEDTSSREMEAKGKPISQGKTKLLEFSSPGYFQAGKIISCINRNASANFCLKSACVLPTLVPISFVTEDISRHCLHWRVRPQIFFLSAGFS